MNDYIIAVDRDGQPYIAHAWGRGANGQHKYIAKIGEGAKARYFYTQEQLRAFQQGARQGAQNAANKAKEKASDAVGRVRENSVLLNVGNQYRAAKGAYQNSKSSDPQTAKWGKKGYDDNNTLGGKVYKAQQKVKDKVKSTKKDVKEKVYINSGAFNRDYAINAKRDFDYARNVKASNANELRENWERSMRSYNNTPLGKLENTKLGYKVINKYAADTPYFNDFSLSYFNKKK